MHKTARDFACPCFTPCSVMHHSLTILCVPRFALFWPYTLSHILFSYFIIYLLNLYAVYLTVRRHWWLAYNIILVRKFHNSNLFPIYHTFSLSKSMDNTFSFMSLDLSVSSTFWLVHSLPQLHFPNFIHWYFLYSSKNSFWRVPGTFDKQSFL